MKNEIITELVSYPLAKQTGAARHMGPSRMEAVGKPQQTTFVWPERKGSSPKK